MTRLQLQPLEARDVPSSTIVYSAASKTVTITGSGLDDNAIVASESGLVKITLQRRDLGPDMPFVTVAEKTYNPRDVLRVNYAGLGANDQFLNTTAIRSFVDGGNGNDKLISGSGNDTIYGGYGFDTIEGGAGNDILVAFNAIPSSAASVVANPVNAGSDVIRGDEGNDVIYGSGNNDSLTGGSGNDSIGGYQGNDTIRGDSGDDKLYGHDGNDTIDGGFDNDLISGWNGRDNIRGSNGNDTIYGGNERDSILGESGNDTIYSGSGADDVDGGLDNDSITGDAGDDSLEGGAGDDTMLGGAGDDNINGSAGNDSIRGEAGRDSLYGGAGNDKLHGGDDSDLIRGGFDHDSISGEAGNDNLFGDSGNDQIFADAGNDAIYGGDDHDDLDGGSGDDSLFGGEGLDALNGADGNDWLDTGAELEWANGGNGYDINARRWAINGTAADDIIQGSIGNCVFVSALASAAEKHNLANRIEYLGDYEYRVELYDPVTLVLKNLIVRFDGRYTVVGTAGYVTAWYKPGADMFTDPIPRTEGEFWTLLYHRAYMKLVNNIDEDFKDPYVAMPALVGRAAFDLGEHFDSTPSSLAALTQEHIEKIVTVGNADDTKYTYSHHSYTVIDVYRGNNGEGAWRITLRNPWGRDVGSGKTSTGANDGYIDVSWERFLEEFDFDRITVA